MIRSGHEEMKDTMRASQERMKVAINSIWSELEENIKNRVEDVLVPVDQRTQGLHEELNAKSEGKQLGLQAVITSLDKQTKSLQEEFSTEIVDTQKGFHKELNFRIPETQSSIQATKTLVQAMQHGLTTSLAKVKDQVEHGPCGSTGTGVGKPPKFDGSTLWAVFHHQFKAVAWYNWKPSEKNHAPACQPAHEVAYGDHHMAAGYHSHPKARTHLIGEALQEFATTIKQVTYCTR
jgi:hypothetical protein